MEEDKTSKPIQELEAKLFMEILTEWQDTALNDNTAVHNAVDFWYYFAKQRKKYIKELERI